MSNYHLWYIDDLIIDNIPSQRNRLQIVREIFELIDDHPSECDVCNYEISKSRQYYNMPSMTDEEQEDYLKEGYISL